MGKNLINDVLLKLQSYARSFLLMIYVNGFCCTKGILPAGEIPQEGGSRAKTAEGASTGNIITKKIGKEGGTIALSSAISVVIPAGALQQETIFGIEMIANTNPAGLSAAYRLTPETITFCKPVTMEFSLQQVKTEISVPDALALSYQTKEGYWNMLDCTIAEDKLTALTKHFGDFGIMQWLFLKPAQASVRVDKIIGLELVRYIAVPARWDDFLVLPLVFENEGLETPVINPVPLESKYIKEWKMDGPGLVFQYRNITKYKAFSSLLLGNTAVVSVELKTKNSKVVLVSNLEITARDCVKVSLNDGPELNLTAAAKYLYNGKLFRILGVLPNDTNKVPIITITGKTRTGSHYWDDLTMGGSNDTCATLEYILPDGVCAEFYEPGDGSYAASPGTLEICEIGKAGEYIAGTFSASRAGYYDASSRYAGSVKIEGEFKAALIHFGNDFPKEKRSIYDVLKQALEKKIHKRDFK